MQFCEQMISYSNALVLYRLSIKFIYEYAIDNSFHCSLVSKNKCLCTSVTVLQSLTWKLGFIRTCIARIFGEKGVKWYSKCRRVWLAGVQSAKRCDDTTICKQIRVYHNVEAGFPIRRGIPPPKTQTLSAKNVPLYYCVSCCRRRFVLILLQEVFRQKIYLCVYFLCSKI